MEQPHFSTKSYDNTSNAGTNYFDSKDNGDVKTNDWSSFADSDLVLALYGIICVLGITGNLLVAIVFLRVPSLRSNTSDFLTHLSLVDFIVCVLVIPFKLVPTTGKSLPNLGFFGELRCRLYVSQFLFWVCVLTSVLGLVTVNLERFAAIVYPHKYKTIFTRRNKYLMIASCWILGILSKSFIFSLYSEDEVIGCRFLGWPSRGVQVVVALYTFTIQLFAPFVVMVLAQWKVISTLKRQVKMLTNRTASLVLNPADQRKMWQLRATQSLVKTLLTFVITFALCSAPVQIVFLVYNFGVPVNFASPVYHIGVILAAGNSCVNPIIYTMTNKPFRRGIREAFRRGHDSAQVGDMPTGTVSLAVSAN